MQLYPLQKHGIGPIEWTAWRFSSPAWNDHGNAVGIDLAMILEPEIARERIVAAREQLAAQIGDDLIQAALRGAARLVVARAQGHDGAVRLIPEEGLVESESAVGNEFEIRPCGEVTEYHAELIVMATDVAYRLTGDDEWRQAILHDLPPVETWDSDLLKLADDCAEILRERWPEVIAAATAAVEAVHRGGEGETLALGIANATDRLRDLRVTQAG